MELTGMPTRDEIADVLALTDWPDGGPAAHRTTSARKHYYGLADAVIALMASRRRQVGGWLRPGDIANLRHPFDRD